MSAPIPKNQDRSDFIRLGNPRRPSFVQIQHNKPSAMSDFYHFHPNIEINYLHDCTMTYAFPGHRCEIPERRFCLFLASKPHRIVNVEGEGSALVFYVPLPEFLQMRLPPSFLNDVMKGNVLCSAPQHDDLALYGKWRNETKRFSGIWQRIHLLEIHAKLLRIAEGAYRSLDNTLKPFRFLSPDMADSDKLEQMISFIAINFQSGIRNGDVAGAAGIGENEAMSIFKSVLGQSIRQYITELRMQHAAMLLRETDMDIVSISMDCGYASMSTFYSMFVRHNGVAPAAFRKRRDQPARARGP